MKIKAQKELKKIKARKAPKKMNARKARKKMKSHKTSKKITAGTKERHEGTEACMTHEQVKHVGT